MKQTLLHPAIEAMERYTEGVTSGDIVACKYVKLAVKRHLDDLEHGAERGLYFDEDAACHICDFFANIQHSKGKWAGEYIKLEDWQTFLLCCLFGWKNEDGTRRFKIAYNEVARKNGKSTLAAGIGIYLAEFDGEEGAEVYSVATKMDQAKIIHHEAVMMVRKSKGLRKRLNIQVNNIHSLVTNSKFEPLGSDAKTLDGLNPHGTLIDELHAHPDGSIYDVMRSAMGSRNQPILFSITTAGFDCHNFCHQQRDYAIKVLEGQVQDDTYFAIIYTLDGYDSTEDTKDDWKDESVWIKANPNLGVSVNLKDMREMAKEAAESSGKLNNFLVKKLNIWTTQTVKWVNLDRWARCNRVIGESELVGQRCFGAFDLSTNTDLAGYGLIFPQPDRYIFIPRLFIPKDNADKRQREDRVPYIDWANQGYLTLTPGNVIDYKAIRQSFWADIQKFNLQMVGFDRWNFEALRQQLIEDGVPEAKMFSFGQGFASMSAPMKKLEEIYLSEKLIYNNHPVIRWMAENLAAKTDPAGNIKPDKEESRERIDGMVILIMALGLAITQPELKPSVYESRGLLMV